GLKPSRGRVSRGPLAGDVTLLSGSGPLARTVEDAAALLDAMAVPRLTEPVLAPALPAGQSFLEHARRPPGPLRIGRYAEPPVPGAELAAPCRQAWEAAATLLGELGHEVVDTTAPVDPETLIPAFEVVWAVGAHSIPVPAGAEDGLQPFTRWLRGQGAGVSAPQFLSALAQVQVAGRRAIAAHAEFDVVLTPALAQLPPPVGWFSSVGPAENFERQKRYTPYTPVYNVTGQPAVSVPLYWTDEGFPVGVQLVGRPAGEPTLLALAGQLQRARSWTQRRPLPWYGRRSLGTVTR
ncbi:MAG TPA: amidase family protein, partial [Pseudonocardiaceae bacterium]|nr:amidase family protein [Pseudonocardiaceae bacterium]